MAGNPRIDDLRKRIEKDPGSRLFAQLAEELRKDGDLEEAIAVAREGLQKHPNYPSARMTLGRALLDTGDFGAARGEFEQVVKGAPDNILAGRYLAECLENLGEHMAAAARYKTTLSLAPGDKQILGRIEALEKGAGTPVPAAPPPSPGLRAPSPPPPSPAPPPPPPPPVPALLEPIRLSEVDGEMELESAHERSAPPAPPPPASGDAAAAPPSAPPIPLVAVEEEFELERPYENPAAAWSTSAPPPPAANPAATVAPAVPVPETPLATPTLAELYFNQGSTQKAIEVYRELVEREPANQRAQARLEELEALARALGAEAPAPARGRAASSEPMFSAPPPVLSPFASAAPAAFDIDMPDDEPSSPPYAPVAAAVPPPTAPTAPPPTAPTAPPPAVVPQPSSALRAQALAPPRDRREAIERTITRLEQFLEKVQRG